ncbi:MAG: hypothetical protein AAF447_09385 [Myxococcota bacterium]
MWMESTTTTTDGQPLSVALARWIAAERALTRVSEEPPRVPSSCPGLTGRDADQAAPETLSACFRSVVELEERVVAFLQELSEPAQGNAWSCIQANETLLSLWIDLALTVPDPAPLLALLTRGSFRFVQPVPDGESWTPLRPPGSEERATGEVLRVEREASEVCNQRSRITVETASTAGGTAAEAASMSASFSTHVRFGGTRRRP